MTTDTRYAPIPLIYKSRGLSARYVQDQAPPESYLDNLNMLERQEEGISSRYGTQIINRDAAGAGTANYFFNSPVTSLTRMVSQGTAYRYAGLASGSLYRRVGNAQGAYTAIYTGLSGGPFGSVVTNCYQSSQSYQFIYDADVSIKDSGTGVPQLTGIDPSPYTLNTNPYSPLLTLIDNFASSNSYTASGFSGSWTYAGETPIGAAGAQMVTDFPEFFQQQTVAGGTVTAVATSTNENVTSSGTYGFTSEAITAGSTVNVVATISGSTNTSSLLTDSGSVEFFYSTNGGASFTPIYFISESANPISVGPINLSFSVTGPANLDAIMMKVVATSSYRSTSPASSVTTIGAISSMTAYLPTTDSFGTTTQGMLSVLNSNASINAPIATITATGLTAGVYTTLTISTQAAHGLTGTPSISIYGCSNDLADGFYTATVTGTNTLTVPYYATVPISATGGFVHGGAAAPATCVLANMYTSPYPTQFSAWGFYQQVPINTSSFPVGSWTGAVAASTTATVGTTVDLDLSINKQVQDGDLIVLTINTSDPAAIENIRLQFDVNGSDYTASYYYKDIAPAYYQQGVQNLESSYDTTEQQILADTLGLITGQPPMTTTAQLQPGNISTGQGSWITVYLPLGNFVPVGTAGQSGLDWSNITGWQLVVTTNTVGSSNVSVNGLYLQWGYGPSSFGGVGYDYRMTYFDIATGTESNGTPEQQFNLQYGGLSSLAAPIFLRQAAQLTGLYSSDPQVSHIRIYRRGGTYSSNWFQIDQVPNITGGGQFTYKDAIPDAVLAQASPLVLDNDPPVTSSLISPILTTLSAPTILPGNTVYSTFVPQLITVSQATAVFVPNQIVLVGYATTLEEVRVITGGTGQFTAILRLQHNAGEPVSVQSIPRQPCNLCALAYNQVWLAGDKNNPNYLYFSKKGMPESFGPEDYIPVGSSGDIITAVVNWRGTLFVATNKTWYSIVGGASPYPQPTGSTHGVIASQGWTQVEAAVWNRRVDGLGEFTGANNQYVSLPIELVYRPNPATPLTPVPLADPTQATQDVMAFYQNSVYTSYISTSGQRYRMIFDLNYKRYRYDDVGATAMLWEEDINTLLVGKQIGVGQYAVCQDQINDYDDGGWVNGALVQTPINITIQNSYQDLGKPHFPKNWNMLETDVNTQGQVMNTKLLFNTEPPMSLTLATANTGTQRNKVELQVNAGQGEEAYSMAIQHTMAVTVAPTFYQENIYAAVLAAYRNSFDTYWIKGSTDESKLCKQGYFDYTSATPITMSLYADGSTTPYYTFTLPINTARSNLPMRKRFPAIKLRQIRCVGVSAGSFQFWNDPVLHIKAIKQGTGYSNLELTV